MNRYYIIKHRQPDHSNKTPAIPGKRAQDSNNQTNNGNWKIPQLITHLSISTFPSEEKMKNGILNCTVDFHLVNKKLKMDVVHVPFFTVNFFLALKFLMAITF